MFIHYTRRNTVRNPFITNEERKEDDTGASITSQQPIYTPNQKLNVTRREPLALCTVKNFSPSGSKRKVSKIKRN